MSTVSKIQEMVRNGRLTTPYTHFAMQKLYLIQTTQCGWLQISTFTGEVSQIYIPLYTYP